MTIHTPDPSWHVRRWEPAPTKQAGVAVPITDHADPERDVSPTEVGVVAAVARTTEPAPDHS
jgi:hypothetical protein